MRIRTVFILLLLTASLVPPGLFGWWTYQDTVRAEFNDVSDRHLLIARNLGDALQRYHKDLDAVSSSVTAALVEWQSYPKIDETLASLHIDYIALVDKNTGVIDAKIEREGVTLEAIDPGLLRLARATIVSGSDQLSFSEVTAPFGEEEGNLMFGFRDLGHRIAITCFNTDYFVSLGKSIAFGIKGHAAIVDHAGNVLSHPLDSWIEARKNIAKVSAVQRMMAGETGVEQFYSPALKGDMIAGFTHVPEVGWGVMIPQPVSELHAKATDSMMNGVKVVGISIAITLISMLLVLHFIGRPINEFILALKSNASRGRFKPIKLPHGNMLLREFKEFQNAYNTLFEEIELANREIKELAYTDSVTSLPNRAKFQVHVEKVLLDEELIDRGGSLIFIDIDNFKIVNDVHGHEVGDRLLSAISRKLALTIEEMKPVWDEIDYETALEPCVSRVGGDEFAIFVPGLNEKLQIDRFLKRLVSEVNNINQDFQSEVSCSASVGLAQYPAYGTTMPELMRAADIAMYQAKKAGKNRYEIFSLELGEITENEICHDFGKAIAENQLILEYQPKVCTRRKAVAGAEALVRWEHPRLGRMSPDVWMPAIANKQLAKDLGDWVINQAMHDLRYWNNSGLDLKVAVNVSPIQLRDRDIVTTLKQSAKKHDVDPNLFELEITEDMLFHDAHQAENLLNEISDQGFKISIDDFGTGYSNLSRLTGLPIDFIKLDQSLIRDALESDKVNSVLDSTITLAKNLDCFVVAEGIETLELAQFATEKGANLLQGYLFSKSLPPKDLVNWIKGEGRSTIGAYAVASSKRAA